MIIHFLNVNQWSKENGGNFGNQNISQVKLNNMIYLIIGFVGSAIWIGFEMWRAPMMDETTGKIIKPGKKISDLWRKRP